MKKLTSNKFIAKARSVHGDRYDYSQVACLGYATKVSVLCREHGAFSISPGNHLSGKKGCPLCAKQQRAAKRTKTTEEFVHEAALKHRNQYDYTKTIYTGKANEVTISCPVHGEFRQKSGVHLRGHGCPECGRVTISQKKRSTLNEFLAKAGAVHGDKYDYSFVDYQGSHKRVTIVCPVHGPFQQLAAVHTHNRAGCPACVGVERYGRDEFINRAKEMHSDKYDYSRVEYVNAKTKIEIICPEHGSFWQPPHHHIKGVGCPGCKADKISQDKVLTQDEFIARAQAIHRGRYDYSKTRYKKGNEKITITCPEHGPFIIETRVHIHQGTGCLDCATSGFNVRKPALLYYLRVASQNGNYLYKIGITNRTVDDRFSITDLRMIFLLRVWEYAEGQDALDRETEILRTHKHHAYGGEPILQSGNSELFVSDVLGLDPIVE